MAERQGTSHMRERDESFWMDAGGRWRHGTPPDDWRQDENGRWHPTVLPALVRPPAGVERDPEPIPPPSGWQPPIERPGARPASGEHRWAGGPPPLPTSPTTSPVNALPRRQPARPAGLPPLPSRRRSPSTTTSEPVHQLPTPMPGPLPLVPTAAATASSRLPDSFGVDDDLAADDFARTAEPAEPTPEAQAPTSLIVEEPVPWAELPELDIDGDHDAPPTWRDPHPSDLHTAARTLPAGTPWPPPEPRNDAHGVTAPALLTGKRNGHALPAPRPEPQGPIQAFKAWPRWGKALLPAAVLLVVVGMVAALTAEPPGFDNETAAPAASPTLPSTTTTVPPTTVSTAAAIAPTTVPQATAPPTTPSTTPPATQSTTPPPTQTPPDGRPNQQHQPPWDSDSDSDSDHGPSPNVGVRTGAYCGPEGASGISHHGVPMTCAMESCDGHRFDQPHWRKAAC